MGWKVSRLIAACGITIAVWQLYEFRLNFTRAPKPDPYVELPRYEVWGIRDLNALVEVSTIEIAIERNIFEPPIKQDVSSQPDFVEVNITRPLPDLPVITATIQIPLYETPDASSMVLGMATTLNRLRDALPAFALWASGTGVRFIVIIAPPTPDTPSKEEIIELYKANKIDLTLIESPLEWYDQYTSLLSALYDHADDKTRWGCIIDDDTFFFSMHRVLSMLDKYDATQPYYIGGLSENKDSMDRIGYLAYGGAGIFLSLPLLRQLRPHVEECISMPDPAGDIRVSSCIYTYSTTKLTWEHYLFQMDLHGDVTGFYEAVRTRPVSTHHWKTWHFHDMVTVGAVSKVCGNECVLQKYQFKDGWMMTNGFSIVKFSPGYQEDTRYIEGAMEHTWADTAWVIPTSWNYTLAPLKPKDTGKVQFLIERVDEDESTMTIFYVKRTRGLGVGIIRIIWPKSNDNPENVENENITT